jgi:vacuolar-type H+-ATPase subunit H
MTSMAEKLGMVREAEDKAEQVLEYYRKMAEETIANTQAEIEKNRNDVEATAREEGEQEMREIIEHARMEGEELRVEYAYDRMRLLAVVVEKRKEAINYLVEKLEKGE